MAPQHAPGTGVFFDCPSRALLEALSQELAGRREGAATEAR
jgi:hypothetical protein